MSRVQQFYFDTYAIIERQSGSPAYERFRDEPVFTHQSNLFEFTVAVLKRSDEARVREQLRLLAPNLLEAETSDIIDAASFKLAHASARISHVDALGYVLARKHGMRFLTGDRAFAAMENVEFVAA